MPYIPHTDDETKTMLATIGVDKIETLFDEIPASLRSNELKNIAPGMNEMTMLSHANQLAAKNKQGTGI